MQNYIALIDNLRSFPAETEYLEFKENFSDFEKEGRDISALANSAAYLGVTCAYKIWGIADDSHDVVGTTFNPRAKKKENQPLELWLRQYLSSNANFDFVSTVYGGKPVVILKIMPALSYPVKFKDIAYIRTNSSTQKLKAGSAREIELWKKVQCTRFEAQEAVGGLTDQEALGYLNANKYFDLLSIPRPETAENILHSFISDGLMTLSDDGTYGINNLGAVLFANDFAIFPTINRKALRVIKYAGRGRTGLRSEKIFDGGYALILDEAYNFIDGAIAPSETIKGAKRELTRMFPDISVRELVVNALIHQDFTITGAGPMVEIFDDRVEITNPGVPLVDPERIINDPPRSRNEALSALMRRFGYCEEAGSGWDKVIEGCEEMRLPAPKIDTRGGSSMRVVMQAQKEFKNLTPDEKLEACYFHACALYESNTFATNSTLRERFGVKQGNAAQISRLIKEAIAAGAIKPVDPDTSPRYMQYKPGWA